MRDDIVGRDEELARLGALLADLAAGGGAMVLRGDAGVGKSTLLGRIAATAAERGTPTVAITGCRPSSTSHTRVCTG
jgi:predicted ATP-dependent serine protease